MFASFFYPYQTALDTILWNAVGSALQGIQALLRDDERRPRGTNTGGLLEAGNAEAAGRKTIREIAATAGINYTTFFRHHTSKEELLNEIAAAEIRTLFELTVPALDATDTRPNVLALCTYVAEHRTLWSRLLTGGAAARLREEFTRLTREFAASHGSDHDWLPPEVGVIFGAGSTFELLTRWLQQEKPIPVEQFALIHERLVVRPLIGSE